MAKKSKKLPAPVLEVQTPIVEVDLTKRNSEMFIEWVQGSSYREIAAKYGIDKNTVWQLSQKNNWHKLRDRFNKQMHVKVMQRILGQRAKVSKLIGDDVQNLDRDVADRKDKLLSKEERDYLLKLFEVYTKETRLEKGLPTESVNTTGTVRHLIISGGPKSSIAISPPANLKTTEQDAPIAEDKKDEIDDDFE